MNIATKTESRPEKLVNPNGQIYGYVRVSTVQQHMDRQLISMTEYGVHENMIFQDKESGKNFNRPAYKKLIRCIRKGDIIVIKSVDRLGRNYQDITDQWKMITQDIGCGIHVLDMPILNTSGNVEDLTSRFISDIFLKVLAFVAQNERENTIKRQQEGINAAKKKRRVHIGRPRKPMPLSFWEIYIAWREGRHKPNDLYRFCHAMWKMSNRTFYRRISELDSWYRDVPTHRLRDVMLPDEYYDGIEFANERLEKGVGIYNQFASHDPTKERRLKRNKQQRLAEMTPEELEKELRNTILRKRQEELHRYLGIRDKDGALIEEEKPKSKPKKYEDLRHQDDPRVHTKISRMEYLRTNHSDNSGMEDAQALIDNEPVVPFDSRPSDAELYKLQHPEATVPEKDDDSAATTVVVL